MSTALQGAHSGRRLGDYELLEQLGSGAFKTVYRAQRREPAREGEEFPEVVALAIPHDQGEGAIELLHREFDAGHRLVHPYIVRTLALDQKNSTWFLMCEFVPGQSLAERIKEGPMDVHLTVRFLALMGEALAYAHQAHIIHRDIKPENIRMGENDVPRILDFGVARVMEYTLEKAYTAGQGSLSYMAPEVIQGCTDHRADLWSLGVTAYEMLTGVRPFGGSSHEAIMKSVLSARYDEELLFQRGIDRTVVRIIRKLLQKNPDRRYQTAFDLVRDLESIARNIRLLDDDEGRLEGLLRASIPIVCVLSAEEERVIESLHSIARRQSDESQQARPLFVWSVSQGLRDATGKLVHPDTVGDPTAALDQLIASPGSAIYAFLDFHRHYTPVTTRLLRDAARVVRSSRKSLVLISPFLQLPPELEKEIHLTAFQLPDPHLLEKTLEEAETAMVAEGIPVALDDEERDQLVRASMGLTVRETHRALNLAAIRNGTLDYRAERTVVDLKTQVIRQSGVLEYIHDSGSFSHVGGLSRLLDWFSGRSRFFVLAAMLPGLEPPKGVMLVGHPGCGKSLCARALAGSWGVPLVRMDVGALFGSYLGQSEANLRAAIQTAEAVSPCVLWIDEIEKAFAGARSGSGSTGRVFGRFLEWLQDKKSPVFVVATANDVRSLPPEFIRKGRFDDVFYVPLPDEMGRREIFKIHLERRGLSPREGASFDLDLLAKDSAAFSGAEIEAAVADARFEAFAGERLLVQDDLLEAVKAIRPLSRSRQKDFDSLAAWAKQNARPAA